MNKILIVDDDKDTLDILSDILGPEGYEVITACNGMDGLRKTRTHLPEMILFDYITKPFDNEVIMFNIRNAFQSNNLTKEVENSRKILQEKANEIFLGETTQRMHVINQVKIVAPTNMTVFVQGETGTGKELIARMIHEESQRSDKPFVVVDCGTIPENLVESELFGYERGAFTGANERKEGKFEVAKGGTLFLDEITNLSQELQAKLLRMIQERNIKHLGSTKEIKIDVRIIAATNTILADEVKEGRFREDLFYRLDEFSINLPPLRETADEIPSLAKHFLEKANVEFDKKIEGISGAAMICLSNYHWPGNVRELRNTIRKAVLLTDSDYITEINLPVNVAPVPEQADLSADLDKGYSLHKLIKKTTDSAEKELIKKALALAKNNKSMAAKILGINRMTLYSKLKSLGL